MIGPDLGAWTHFNKTEMDQLEAVYKKTKKQEEDARHNAAVEIMTYVKELAEAAGQTKTQPAAPSQSSSEDSTAGS
jgi:Sec-independent protein translocase protein TatA